VGSLILTGSTTPFHHQSIHVRTSILDGWRQSYLPPLPTLYKSFTALGKSLWFKTSPTFSKLAGFPKVPQPYKPGPHYEYEFLQFPPGDSPEVIETDVIIVGSGCGGGVCAKNLSEAGHRVLVLDKSYYYPPSQLPMSETEAGIHLFENGGVDVSDDSSISVIAGSTWGGGGTVNWSVSLQTQGFVRKEWAEDRGLKFFGTEEFQNCLDRVCDRMGVSADHIRHNHGNQVLLEGARKLGYHAKGKSFPCLTLPFVRVSLITAFLQLFPKTPEATNTIAVTARSAAGQPKSRVRLSPGYLMQLVQELHLLKASRSRASCLRWLVARRRLWASREYGLRGIVGVVLMDP
jgi:hypothetical protein